jgi:hypothetical protein
MGNIYRLTEQGGEEQQEELPLPVGNTVGRTIGRR